uniref:NR LBD domain-containing protein n=1 Tax=Laticauda laticaudata TaxID=8630 RepID=A0A8C5SNU7_LATLA
MQPSPQSSPLLPPPEPGAPRPLTEGLKGRATGQKGQRGCLKADAAHWSPVSLVCVCEGPRAACGDPPSSSSRFAKLLLRLPALRSIGLKCLEHLFFFKLIGDTPIDTFLMEMLEAPHQMT